MRIRLLLPLALCAAFSAQAQEKFTYLTNWYAQAEHGGFYQALATGLYKKEGLDVTIRMGGPQVNGMQLLAAGQADCFMGYDVQTMKAWENGIPTVTVAAAFQKDPQVLIGHPGVVNKMEDLKGKTILISAAANNTYWPWLMATYKLDASQARPYTFNIQPFIADKNVVQQGYLSSEPYAIEKEAKFKPNVFLLADHGWPPYATTIACNEKAVKERPKAVAAFVKASMEGWKSFLENPAPAIPLIKKDNPNMTDEQIAYSVAKLKEMGIIASGDARTAGIGILNESRIRQNIAFLQDNKIVEPGKIKLEDAFKLDAIKATKVLP